MPIVRLIFKVIIAEGEVETSIHSLYENNINIILTIFETNILSIMFPLVASAS